MGNLASNVESGLGRRSYWKGKAVSREIFDSNLLNLLREASRNGNQIIVDSVRLKASHANIARLAGVDRSTITLAIKRLSERNLISSSEEESRSETAHQKEYDVSYEDFLTNPLIQKFVDSVGTHKSRLIFLPVMYRILTGRARSDFKCSPENLTKEIAEQFISQTEKETGKRCKKSYVMALRHLLVLNGVMLHRGRETLLAGEKRNFGAYGLIGAGKVWENRVFEIARFFRQKSYTDALAFMSISLNAFPRPRASIKVRISDFNFEGRGEPFKASIWESKTGSDGKAWRKRFITKEICEILFDYSHSHRERIHLFLDGNFDVSAKRFDESSFVKTFEDQLTQKFLEAYSEIGLISKNREDWKGYQLKTESWYLSHKPLYSFRHIGAHYILRRIGYGKAGLLAAQGWDDPSMLTKVYAAVSEEEIDSAYGIFHRDGVPCRCCSEKFKNIGEMERHIVMSHWIKIGEAKTLAQVIAS